MLYNFEGNDNTERSDFVIAEIIKNHLNELDRISYEKQYTCWTIPGTDCLKLTWSSGLSTTYMIFKGPWTQQEMCRDCGDHYEVVASNQIYKIKKGTMHVKIGN